MGVAGSRTCRISLGTGRSMGKVQPGSEPAAGPEAAIESPVTIRDAANAFLLRCESRQIKNSTLRKYRTFISSFSDPDLRDLLRHLAEISLCDLQVWSAPPYVSNASVNARISAERRMDCPVARRIAMESSSSRSVCSAVSRTVTAAVGGAELAGRTLGAMSFPRMRISIHP